jgi:hypothetical protein
MRAGCNGSEQFDIVQNGVRTAAGMELRWIVDVMFADGFIGQAVGLTGGNLRPN